MAVASVQPVRLYQRVADQLIAGLRGGRYKIGDRLPSERELAASYGISRLTVDQALLVLELANLIEKRVGSGAHVIGLPKDGFLDFKTEVSLVEVLEALQLLLGEAAAIATIEISEGELSSLDEFLQSDEAGTSQERTIITYETVICSVISRSTGNGLVVLLYEQLLRQERDSIEALPSFKTGTADEISAVVTNFRGLLSAMRQRDQLSARGAMRSHFAMAIDRVLLLVEEEAVNTARQSLAGVRSRYKRIFDRYPVSSMSSK